MGGGISSGIAAIVLAKLGSHVVLHDRPARRPAVLVLNTRVCDIAWSRAACLTTKPALQGTMSTRSVGRVAALERSVVRRRDLRRVLGMANREEIDGQVRSVRPRESPAADVVLVASLTLRRAPLSKVVSFPSIRTRPRFRAPWSTRAGSGSGEP